MNKYGGWPEFIILFGTVSLIILVLSFAIRSCRL